MIRRRKLSALLALCAALFVMFTTACPSTPKTPEQKAEEHYQRARTYIDQEKFDDAVNELQTAIQVYPQHVESQALLGHIHKIVADIYKEDVLQSLKQRPNYLFRLVQHCIVQNQFHLDCLLTTMMSQYYLICK